MLKPNSDLLWSILRCPQCGSKLSREGSPRCHHCSIEFQRVGSSLDFRLKHAKSQMIEFELPGCQVPIEFDFGPLEFSETETPLADFTGVPTPWHLRRALLSYFPRATSSSSIALDLGCGTGLHRAVCEHLGFSWVGLDQSAPGAPILGDAHALPFADESIDFVLSIAVLEHLQFPAVALREVCRVLRPGGLFIGTVAFLEPFHGNSYYHHTHIGTFSSLAVAGFLVERVAPNPHWSGLAAQATMDALFPKMPQSLGRAVIWPIEMLHKLWWFVGGRLSVKANETTRLVTTTGAFEFVARKPGASLIG